MMDEASGRSSDDEQNPLMSSASATLPISRAVQRPPDAPTSHSRSLPARPSLPPSHSRSHSRSLLPTVEHWPAAPSHRPWGTVVAAVVTLVVLCSLLAYYVLPTTSIDAAPNSHAPVPYAAEATRVALRRMDDRSPSSSPLTRLLSSWELPASSSYALNHSCSTSQQQRAAMVVVLIADVTKRHFAEQVIRSIAVAQSGDSDSARPCFHLLTDPALEPSIRRQLSAVPGVDGPIGLHVYDIAECNKRAGLLQPFASRDYPIPSLCKLFLAQLLPHLERVLVLDSGDVSAVQDVSPCLLNSASSFSGQQLFALSVDMGESCQRSPDSCWPRAAVSRVPPGPFHCGGLPAATSDWPAASLCPAAGELEPVTFNSAVAVFDLRAMRQAGFVERLVRATVYTARTIDFKPATWGEQDFLNNYLRFYPTALVRLPCGCNYQYTAKRKELRCGVDQPLYFVNGDSTALTSVTDDAYNQLYQFWQKEYRNESIQLPEVSLESVLNATLLNGTKPAIVAAAAKAALKSVTMSGVACPLQPGLGGCVDHVLPVNDTSQYGAPVYVLTRTSQQPELFRELRDSMAQQMYPQLVHLVATDSADSLSYAQGDVVVVSSGGSGPQCSSGSGAAAYLNDAALLRLQRYVSADGWLLYLDDDKVLLAPHTVAHIMAQADSTYDLLTWKVMLPLSQGDMPEERAKVETVQGDAMSDEERVAVVSGYEDVSGFMFHSRHINRSATAASTPAPLPDSQCDGSDSTLSASALSQQLRAVPLDSVHTTVNPMQPILAGGEVVRGGIVQQDQAVSDKVTIIITSYQAISFRISWTQDTIKKYLSPSFAPLVDRVILVWNNPDEACPVTLKHERLLILPQTVNSLNNRWIDTLPHIRTHAVLNLDDDIYVTKAGMMCLLNWWRREPDRLVAPFVRRITDYKYGFSELFEGEPFSVVLPRFLLLHKRFLHVYANSPPALLRYVDEQEAHCDDILLNAMVVNATQKTALRVQLPQGSVIDHFSSCFRLHREEVGGLALQKDRKKERTRCVKGIAAYFPAVDNVLNRTSTALGLCAQSGVITAVAHKPPPGVFQAMLSQRACLLPIKEDDDD